MHTRCQQIASLKMCKSDALKQHLAQEYIILHTAGTALSKSVACITEVRHLYASARMWGFICDRACVQGMWSAIPASIARRMRNQPVLQQKEGCCPLRHSSLFHRQNCRDFAEAAIALLKRTAVICDSTTCILGVLLSAGLQSDGTIPAGTWRVAGYRHVCSPYFVWTLRGRHKISIDMLQLVPILLP